MNVYYLVSQIPTQNKKIHVLNNCILYTKYFIYIQRLLRNNSLDVYANLMQIKEALQIEFTIGK